MRYAGFSLRNFKGVDHASVRLGLNEAANVTTLIGLNESGKTTILEGIYSFSPDQESKNLFADQKVLGPDITTRIPRSKLYNFTDKIIIKASVVLEPGELEAINLEVRSEAEVDLDISEIPAKFTISDVIEYNNSKMVKRGSTWNFPIQVRGLKAKKYRDVTKEERPKVFSILRRHLPSIAYFPTFLSDVPAKIYLSGHAEDERNSFYRKVFQDILDTLGGDISIENQILERLKPPSTFAGTIAQSISSFWGSTSKGMVQQVVDKASAQLSRVIVTRWNQMFENRPVGKEIVIEWGIDENAEEGGADPYISFRGSRWSRSVQYG